MIRKIGPFLILGILFACTPSTTQVPPTSTPAPAVTISPEPDPTQSSVSFIPLNTSWQIQYTGEMDYDLDVDIYNLDLFETDPIAIAQLKQRDIFVICYFSAGTHENWRPDANQFPADILGKPLDNWEGETWLDIRRIDLLKPIIENRLDLAAQNDCDGVDPDNVDGYQNDTGFPLTANDQKAFNIFLSTQAHTRGLFIGLKNDLEQVPELLPFFDWALSEECFFHDECYLLMPFILADKPVFVIEYQLTPEEFCFKAREMKVNALRKNLELDAFRFSCNQ